LAISAASGLECTVAEDDELLRIDETQFRLLEWTQGQAPAERLAAQILDAEGFKDVDPSHPLGGKDGGRDGECTRDGEPWVWAAYFPRGQQNFNEIKTKFSKDIEAARKHNPTGVAFVTNQELRLDERKQLRLLASDFKVRLLHLERVATVLDRPTMAPVRRQYLRIAAGPPPMMITPEVLGFPGRFIAGDALMDTVVGFNGEQERKREKAARDADAQRRRKERARQAAASQPWRVGGMGSFLDDSAIMGRLTEQYSGQFPIAGGQKPKPAKPRSDEEFEAALAQFAEELAGRWGRCMEYLASVAWPALHFRITNEAEAFLKNVQVILTFHNAKGLKYIDPSKFEWDKLEDPDWERPVGPFGVPQLLPELPRPAGYPVEWENDGDNLVVTITLPELRPHPPKKLEGDDVVLMVADSRRDALKVTWTATAEGYGRPLEGEPFELSVVELNALESVRALTASAKS
jgi:hypothetical protein